MSTLFKKMLFFPITFLNFWYPIRFNDAKFTFFRIFTIAEEINNILHLGVPNSKFLFYPYSSVRCFFTAKCSSKICTSNLKFDKFRSLLLQLLLFCDFSIKIVSLAYVCCIYFNMYLQTFSLLIASHS